MILLIYVNYVLDFCTVSLRLMGMIRMIVNGVLRLWEWCVLVLVLAILGLFLTGFGFFGLSGLLAALLALMGGIVVSALSIIGATLVLPLIALALGFATAVVGAVTTLLGFVVGGLFTPLAAVLTGWVTTLFTWIAGTWLGTLLTPLYSSLAPLVLKISPWITTTTFGRNLYDWLDDQPWWPQSLVFTGKRGATPPPPEPDTPTQNARRGRSSGPEKRRSAPPRTRG